MTGTAKYMAREHSDNPRAAAPVSPGSSSHAAAWVTCAVAVPVLYFLSIGPMVALDTRLGFGPGSHLWLGQVYAPLIWIADRNDAFAQVLDVYVRWCGGSQGCCG